MKQALLLFAVALLCATGRIVTLAGPEPGNAVSLNTAWSFGKWFGFALTDGNPENDGQTVTNFQNARFHFSKAFQASPATDSGKSYRLASVRVGGPMPFLVKHNVRSENQSIAFDNEGIVKAFLRVKNDTGLYFRKKGINVDLGYATGIEKTVGVDRIYFYSRNTPVPALAKAKRIAFKAEGFRMVVLADGKEVLTANQYDVLNPGTIQAKGDELAYFINNPLLTYYPSSKGIRSNLAAGIIDVWDWGAKPVVTLANGVKGSRVVKVASAANLKPGDQIIIAPKRTKWQREGPGGIWPEETVRNAAALSTLTRPEGAIVSTEDDLKTYVVEKGRWQPIGRDVQVAHKTHRDRWYFEARLAKPYRGIVQQVQGSSLTLDKPLQSTFNGYTLYFDNHPVVQRFSTEYKPTLRPFTLYFPQGTWAFSESWDVTGWNKCTVTGAGKGKTTLLSPSGCPLLNIDILQSPNTTVKNLTFRSSGNDTAYGLVWFNSHKASSGDGYVTSGRFYDIHQRFFIRGLSFGSGSHNAVVKGVRFVDGWSGILSFSSRNCLVDSFEVTHTTGVHHYAASMTVSDAGSDGSTWRNGTFNSPTLFAGFEPFNAKNVRFENISAENVTTACNSSSGTRMKGIRLRFRGNWLPSWRHPGEAVISDNQNAYGGASSSGNAFDDVHIAFESPGDKAGTVLRGWAIEAGAAVTSITNSSYTGSGQAIIATGKAATIQNFTATGWKGTGCSWAHNSQIGVYDGTVENVTADGCVTVMPDKVRYKNVVADVYHHPGQLVQARPLKK